MGEGGLGLPGTHLQNWGVCEVSGVPPRFPVAPCSLQNGSLVSCWGPHDQLPMTPKLAVGTPLGICASESLSQPSRLTPPLLV